jgi:amino acid transporter
MTTSTEDLKDQLLERSKPASFKKTIGLFGATTLGIGALMGAGLYVLVGVAAAEAGPGIWAAYMVCGLLTFLSVLMFADFSARLPISGGGYIYAYRSLGSFWGFMVGWHLAVGSIFACALYAVGFASYAGAFLPSGIGSSGLVLKVLAAALVVLLTVLGLRGGKGGDRLQSLFTWGNLLVLVVLVAASLSVADSARFTPAFPRGAAGVGSAISLIYISFFGYQLIANSAEEVRDPTKTVPRAMILSMGVALVFYLMVAVVAVAVVDWQELAWSEAPLTLVAARGLGRWGAALIGVGGILASGAALNGTLFSQGRQIYAMGRDRLLPSLMGTLSGSSKVPVPALLAGGAATICVVLLGDLSFIAKSANFALLFSMLPVSVALHWLHVGQGAGAPVVPLWRRVVPWTALVANAGLILTLDWQSLLFGGAMVGAGCVVFLGYSYSSEKRGQAGFSVDLTGDRGFSLLGRGERVLVPMANPKTQESLFSIARAMLPPGGEIVVLNAVLAESDQGLRQVLAKHETMDEAIAVLERAIELARVEEVTFRPVVRAVRSLPEGIVHAALEEGCQLIIMGWSMRDASSPSRLLEEVVSQVRSDIIFLQHKGEQPFRRIGVSLGGRGNLALMVRVACTLAEEHGGEVIYFNVMPELFEREDLDHAREIQVEAISRHSTLVPFGTELLRSENPLGAIVERSRGLDLLILGSAQVGALRSGAVGTFSSMVANQAHCSVVIVRHVPSLGRMIPPQAQSIRDLGGDMLKLGARALPGRRSNGRDSSED